MWALFVIAALTAPIARPDVYFECNQNIIQHDALRCPFFIKTPNTTYCCNGHANNYTRAVDCTTTNLSRCAVLVNPFMGNARCCAAVAGDDDDDFLLVY